jgi:hypothetical protein
VSLFELHVAVSKLSPPHVVQGSHVTAPVSLSKAKVFSGHSLGATHLPLISVSGAAQLAHTPSTVATQLRHVVSTQSVVQVKEAM